MRSARVLDAVASERAAIFAVLDAVVMGTIAAACRTASAAVGEPSVPTTADWYMHFLPSLGLAYNTEHQSERPPLGAPRP